MIGQQIGNYRLVKLLGAGGMGMVYEAVHDGIGGRAAIKVLRPEIASNKDATQRFFSEARAANLIAHPGIVHIFDCGYTASGIAYLTMEFLEGETLRQRLDRLRILTVSEAIRIMRQVAAALLAAHARSVIHRDLKPDNLMLVRDAELPGGERIKILDFGVAKISEGLAEHTRTGMLMGTPAYMAPEQCREAKLATDRSDVYSLGVILYQVLAGQPPFQGEYAGDVMAMQMMQEPPPLAQFCPRLQRPVIAFVHRLLEKKPAMRPSMEEVIRELQRLHDLVVGSQTQVPRPEPAPNASPRPVQQAPRGRAVTEALSPDELRQFAPTAPRQAVSVPLQPNAAASSSVADRPTAPMSIQHLVRPPLSAQSELEGEPTALAISAQGLLPIPSPVDVRSHSGRELSARAQTTVTMSSGQRQKRPLTRVIVPMGVVLFSLSALAMYFALGHQPVDSPTKQSAKGPVSDMAMMARHDEQAVIDFPPTKTEQQSSESVDSQVDKDNADSTVDAVKDDVWRPAYKAYRAGQHWDAIRRAVDCKGTGASKYKCPWILGMASCRLIAENQDPTRRPALNQLLKNATDALRKQSQPQFLNEVQDCVAAIPTPPPDNTPPPAEIPIPKPVPSELRIPNFEFPKTAPAPAPPSN